MKLKLISGILLVVVISMSSCKAKKELAAAQTQIQQLQSDLTSCNTNLTNTTNANNAKIADLNNQISTLTSQNASLSKDAMAYRQLKDDLKARQEMLNAALAEQGTSLREIREKIIAGLSSLADSGINVEFKNGFLYVSLPESLLFPQGSATLGKKSKDALSPLASVLNNYPRVQIYVIGHTDTLKIHNARFADNWSLSTERANSIVRVLRDTYSVDPARLLSGGRSKYNPVADNSTAEGRAQNRRIQIILNPDLSKLWDMMGQ
ncbi:MAG TPA: OmpA family protein [Puia sp.]|nr:OmpA family protein [Puia sp.]